MLDADAGVMTSPLWLSGALQELREMSDDPPPRYRDLYQAVLDGRVPARSVRGRWTIDRPDLPVVAREFGMRLRNSAV
jgi:hypothetical protein